MYTASDDDLRLVGPAPVAASPKVFLRATVASLGLLRASAASVSARSAAATVLNTPRASLISVYPMRRIVICSNPVLPFVVPVEFGRARSGRRSRRRRVGFSGPLIVEAHSGVSDGADNLRVAT
jgi:hypothetical protein